MIQVFRVFREYWYLQNSFIKYIMYKNVQCVNKDEYS